uniref:HECT domain-containing protein n=2 Tax=Photinus pyralis TaxID=7054 RepID=A0A1Y1LU81_PHOPY
MGSGAEIKDLLTEILTSSEFCNVINNALSSRLTTTPAISPTVQVPTLPGRNTSETPPSSRMSMISSRIHEMFPSIPRARHSRSQSRNSSRGLTPFEKEVFLIKRKSCEETLKRNEKFDAFKDGYAKPAVKLYTQWKVGEIKQHLREVFQSVLTNTDFDFLMPVSGYLSKIDMEDLNGARLKALLRQKPLYLRPHVDLVQDDNDEGTFEETDYTMNDLEEFPDIRSLDDHTQNVNSFTLELQALHNKITESVTYFNVNREDIFLTCKLALQRKSFNPFNRLSVNFVDSDENTEGAIDGGGPSAEMFRLCMSYFLTSCLFDGNNESKNLTYCIEQLQANNYYYCGQIIGMSILHGFGGPNFISQALFDFLLYGIDGMAPNIDDVPEGTLKTILHTMHDCNDVVDLQNIILDEDMISISGWSFISDITEKEKLIADVCKFHVALRVRPALEQFESGLKSCEIHHLINKYPSDMKSLFCFTATKLTFSKMKELFSPVLNPQGSNLRSIENRVLGNYYNFVADCEGLF